MIKQKTVFILGAGASVPFGYPTSIELRERICHDKIDKIVLKDNRLIPYYEIENFKIKFSNSLNLSIDLFLSRNKQFESIGKYAIINQILNAELESKEPSDIYGKQNWISYLYDRITKKFKDSSYYKIADNKLKIITFNYDRLVENSLYKALCNTFTSINVSEFKNEMLRLNIMHVYGKIVPLDWEKVDGIRYKTGLGIVKKIDYLNNISVLYDQRDIENRELIDQSLQSAQRIFFLGFGYADENLDVLNLTENLNNNQQIFGTAYGLTKNEIEKTKWKLKSYVDKKPINEFIIQDCDCLTLLRDYL